MTRYRSDQPIGTISEKSYGRTVVRGSVHTALSQVVAISCQMLSVIVLSRLLDARDFGLVAMIGPVIAFLSMFKEMGLLQAVIQNKNLTYGQLNALFWINIAASVALVVLIWVAAPLIVAFYGEPDLLWLLRVTALNMFLSALGAQHFALLNRDMRFGLIAINAGVIAISTVGVSVIWALIAPSPWALVGGTVAGAIIGSVMVWVWVPWIPGLPARAPGTGALLGFGMGVTGFKMANFWSRSLDNVLIGRVYGGEALGYYDRAYKLLLFPISRISQPLSRVMVPVLSRLQDEPERYARAFFRVYGLVQLAILPGIAALAAMSDTAVPFLLGEKWAPSAPIFAALGLAGLSQPLANPTGWLFISQGRTTEWAGWGLFAAIAICTAFAVGVQFGVVQLAYAYAATTLSLLFPLWFLITRKGPIGRDALRARILPVFLSGVVAFTAIKLVEGILPGSALPKLLGGTIFCYCVFAAAMSTFAFGRDTLREAGQLSVKSARRGTSTLKRLLA